jgi:1-deoxy-D-xylulose 5-phosphate reductoisomerase
MGVGSSAPKGSAIGDGVALRAHGSATLCLDGHVTPIVLNATNEIAVQAFLERRLGFLDIAMNVETTDSRRTGI